MSPVILLTGIPGCGKTTLIRKVLARLDIPAGGFYTQEIRQGGMRQGFEIVTLDGQRAVMAHVNIRGAHRVGKYGVDVTALDGLAVSSMRQAAERGALVVVDEIGPMELHSRAFRQTLMELLESSVRLLGTIHQRGSPFIDAIKRRPDVTLLEVRPENREVLLWHLLKLLASPEFSAKP